MNLRAQVEAEGFAMIPGVFSAVQLEPLVRVLPQLGMAAGTRNLLATGWGLTLAEKLEVRALVEDVLGPGARAVRGILFDKTPATNWNLDWHQDTKIAIAKRVDAEGFKGEGRGCLLAWTGHFRQASPFRRQAYTGWIHMVVEPF